MKFMALLLPTLISACAASRPPEPASGSASGPTASPTPAPVNVYVPPAPPTPTPAVEKWCARMDLAFQRYGWGASRCREFTWNHVRNSEKGIPLPWAVFGSEENLAAKNVTLLMCGVHGDEITPVKFCFDVLYDLRDFHWDLTNRVVVVAPLVSPDSFFVERPTRTNGRGVDVNRNFPTKDWQADALRLWKHKHRRDKRRFPGHKALSEQETVFQVNLIKRYQPSKIISVHSPLGLLDFDGPDLKKDSTRPAKDLLLSMSEKAEGYKVSNYPHFPGSLGNWAGRELGIPTYTLELPDSDPRNSDRFWKLFREAIHHAIEREVGPIPEPLPGAAAAPAPSA